MGEAAAATQPYKELFLPILNISHLGEGLSLELKGLILLEMWGRGMAAGSRGDLPGREWMAPSACPRAALFVPLPSGSSADPSSLHVLQAELCSGLWQSLRWAAAAEDSTSLSWAGFPAPAADSHSPDP